MKRSAAFALAGVLAGAFALISVDAADAQSRSKKKAATPPPAAAAPAPEAPAAPPAITVEPIGAALPAYAAFHTDITGLQGQSVMTPADLDAVLERAAGQNAEALARGWLAYGALTAAQSPAFVQGVRETANFYGKEKFLFGLTIDTSYASTLKGYAEAQALILQSARADGRRIEAVGERYKEMGYSLQRQRWGGQVASNQNARLTRLRAAATGALGRQASPDVAPRLVAAVTQYTPGADASAFGGALFWDNIRAAPGSVAIANTVSLPQGMEIKPHRERGQAFNIMTTLAAIYIMDWSKEPSAQVDRLLSHPSAKRCFELVQAQFYQCVSAARFHYENAFCMGEHAIKDVGVCIGGATELQSTAQPAISTPPAAEPAPAPAASAPAPAQKKKKR
jgi:hypothetical protein